MYTLQIPALDIHQEEWQSDQTFSEGAPEMVALADERNIGEGKINVSQDEEDFYQHEGVGLNFQQVGDEEEFPQEESSCSPREDKVDPPGTPGDIDKQEKEEQEQITIRQLRSGSMFWIPIQVENVMVRAIVDSAAEVTIISQEVHQKLIPLLLVIRRITLNTAGKCICIPGTLVGPVTLLIPGRKFKVNVYVAPIEDNMLLGLDFMKRQGISLALAQSQMILQGQIIPMQLGRENTPDPNSNPCTAKVAVSQHTVIPPRSVANVTCELDNNMPQYLVEPLDDGRVPIIRILHQKRKTLQIFVLNVIDRNITLKRQTHVANAEAAWEVLPSSAVSVRLVGEAPQETHGNLPTYMVSILWDIEETLTAEQVSQLTHLLLTNKDVFAASEFDLESFNEVSHHINTGNARPVKQKIRRTPACFAQEEKGHLQHMLDAGIVTPSMSEWASAPVLVRKRDTSVRWCVDYRELNSRTINDVYPLPLVDELLDTLAGIECFSKFDANSAYYQINVAEEDRKKTAFITKYGLFEFKKMAFGLCNAPATYARVMNLVL
nr:uncharacterized protein LOC123752056 [Procambarus clarkii]